MSPRRSSRARSLQQPASASSNSSSTLKSTRAGLQRSESTESPAAAADETNSQDTGTEIVVPRRSRRGGGDDFNTTAAGKGSQASAADKADIDDEDLEENVEEEITRCICGQLEYPGPSQGLKELATQQGLADSLSEDLGNFFVQCDNDSVWQHAGCVGLTDENNLPEEYYCEVCKPKFHEILRGPNGTKTSRYLPVVESKSTRSSSLSSSGGDQTRRKSSVSKHSETTKRRATMNSRGAYDEDEMLRRAIEESKETGTLGKRGRETTDDPKQVVKRQRTNSSSPSTDSKRSKSPSLAVEDPPRGTSGKHKLRGVTIKNKEKELRDKQKEQTAAMRAEAASKRNARSERRRGDESPPPTPGISPSKMANSMATVTSKVKAETPPANRAQSKGKTGRPARRGRLGRNQYTRDPPAMGDNSDTPARDTSHDGQRGSPNGVNINGESGRSSKAKTHPARMSMNEMKRRVAAILEFVGRMQTERGTASHVSSGSASSKGANTPNGIGNADAGLPTANLVKAALDADNEVRDANGVPDGGLIKMRDDRDFQVMASGEMMDALTKELVSWQRVYGIYSR